MIQLMKLPACLLCSLDSTAGTFPFSHLVPASGRPSVLHERHSRHSHFCFTCLIHTSHAHHAVLPPALTHCSSDTHSRPMHQSDAGGEGNNGSCPLYSSPFLALFYPPPLSTWQPDRNVGNARHRDKKRRSAQVLQGPEVRLSFVLLAAVSLIQDESECSPSLITRKKDVSSWHLIVFFFSLFLSPLLVP